MAEDKKYSGEMEGQRCLWESLMQVKKEHLKEILSIDEIACEHIANENCRIKYEVVIKDERDSGFREILNLGHTVGRAIETVSGYKLLHGEALLIGIAAEVQLSYKLGYMTDTQKDEVIALLKKAYMLLR